ncbi:MAG TPA: DciA family protein [Rhizomicrobium sp.]|nr:DciA family protein [Rhizomicrobium sp.]
MAQTPSDKQEPPQRRNRADAVSRDATIAARFAFTRAGFSDPTLVLHWTEIAGPEAARLARPIKLTQSANGGTLTLKAEPAAAVFLQHESRALCARINAYLGRNAVARLRFVQGSLAAPPPPPPERPGPSEPPAADPARRWQGPSRLGEALLKLARSRRRVPGAD